MTDEPDPERSTASLTRVLDAFEVGASTLYLFLIAIIVGAAIAVLWYLIGHAPADFGLQGEWFYVGLAFLLLMAWAIGQTAWILKRRRKSPQQNAASRGKGAWTWNVGSSIPVTTFKINETQLSAALAAADTGCDWDEVCRRVNPTYDALSDLDQGLYRQAIRMAVDETRKTQE
jgi:hypothetical protein